MLCFKCNHFLLGPTTKANRVESVSMRLLGQDIKSGNYSKHPSVTTETSPGILKTFQEALSDKTICLIAEGYS